ncbi:MAG TPA: hypothetical protein VFK32_04070 [Tepidiformaceae bacterium]|nr:hypothetical protein [Tepidiformaceae bacterium]
MPAVILNHLFQLPNTVCIIRAHDARAYSLLGWAMLVQPSRATSVYVLKHGAPIGTVATSIGVVGSGITTACIWRWRIPASRHNALASSATRRCAP